MIPGLLGLLDLVGAIVTLDLASCQTGIAQQIRGQGREYLLAVSTIPPGPL